MANSFQTTSNKISRYQTRRKNSNSEYDTILSLNYWKQLVCVTSRFLKSLLQTASNKANRFGTMYSNSVISACSPPLSAAASQLEVPRKEFPRAWNEANNHTRQTRSNIAKKRIFISDKLWERIQTMPKYDTVLSLNYCKKFICTTWRFLTSLLHTASNKANRLGTKYSNSVISACSPLLSAAASQLEVPRKEFPRAWNEANKQSKL